MDYFKRYGEILKFAETSGSSFLASSIILQVEGFGFEDFESFEENCFMFEAIVGELEEGRW